MLNIRLVIVYTVEDMSHDRMVSRKLNVKRGIVARWYGLFPTHWSLALWPWVIHFTSLTSLDSGINEYLPTPTKYLISVLGQCFQLTFSRYAEPRELKKGAVMQTAYWTSL